jgi:anaerobic selenocysteine-containing dehydrogenase/Fe-S-cluster-containing dehydrogenase component
MSKGMERRKFLKVLGASGAGSSLLAGCSPATGADKLIPYVIPHEDIVPGVSTWYHTTCRECPAGCGMSIRTREGRAVKAEGNPLSPISHGRLCARGQASLHGLYDPDRIPQPLGKRAGETDWEKIGWDDAEQRVYNELVRHRGRSVFLTQTYTGTLDQLIDDWCAAMGVQRVRYEPFGWEAVRAGYQMVFGSDAVPVHDFSNADTVITFGADFLETWISPVDYAHGFVQSHSYSQGRRGKLISITPHQSLTDMNADEWIAIKPGTEHIAALAIARLIGEAGGGAAGAGGAVLSSPAIAVEQAAQTCGVSADQLRSAARDFARNGRSLAVGPGVASSHRAANAVGAAVAILNQVAGNIGRTVRIDRREEHTATGSYRTMQDLLTRINAGQVTALLTYGPNPLYSMPEHGTVLNAIQRLSFFASFSPYLDETSQHAHLLLPDHHFLESWGDYVPRTGVRSLIQPVMTPVFNTKQTADVLLAIAQRARANLPNAAPTYYDYLRGRWTREVLSGVASTGGGVGDDTWREALKVGVVNTTGTAPAPSPSPSNAIGLSQLRWEVPTFSGNGEFHLVVYPSYRFYDGRLANRPWLQELPDPVSKFTWSSWVEISPAAADRLGLDTGHMVKLRTTAGETEELPVFVHPGTRDDVIAVQLGQGHTGHGRYAQERGVNPIRLLQAEADATSGGLVWFQTKASIEKSGGWKRPAQAGLIDDQNNREIARTVSVNSARDADIKRGFLVAASTTAPAAQPQAGVTAGHAEGAPQRAETHEEQAIGGGHGAEEVHPSEARVHELQAAGGMVPAELDASPKGYPHTGMHYGEYTDAAPRWGMSIDLDKCIGCSACVTACYAENNIGIVGPQQVAMGRILHWIRIERYFERDDQGHLKNTAFVPMTCQHCGNAPCEPVCPVYAAYHTPDGLNAQVYNRCVGTRYCANNCPYKVRVFNWYSWEWPEPLNWQLNPDVTVREKGVMEKCTFCVQRIRDAQNHARVEDRAVSDGEIVPACAQTCPGNAIVFGNVKDPNSLVARVAASGRGYRVLEGLNTQSAITYLKRVSHHEAAEPAAAH